jgi:hypothetical protein
MAAGRNSLQIRSFGARGHRRTPRYKMQLTRRVIFADYPPGGLTGMLSVVVTVLLVLLCLFSARVLSSAGSQRGRNRWLVAAGICVVGCIVTCVAARVLKLP